MVGPYRVMVYGSCSGGSSSDGFLGAMMKWRWRGGGDGGGDCGGDMEVERWCSVVEGWGCDGGVAVA